MTNNNAINGIRCDVTNCHYHRTGGKCVANEIKVGPQYANSSMDTVCDTFKPENGNQATMITGSM